MSFSDALSEVTEGGVQMIWHDPCVLDDTHKPSCVCKPFVKIKPNVGCGIGGKGAQCEGLRLVFGRLRSRFQTLRPIKTSSKKQSKTINA